MSPAADVEEIDMPVPVESAFAVSESPVSVSIELAAILTALAPLED